MVQNVKSNFILSVIPIKWIMCVCRKRFKILVCVMIRFFVVAGDLSSSRQILFFDVDFLDVNQRLINMTPTER